VLYAHTLRSHTAIDTLGETLVGVTREKFAIILFLRGPDSAR
jgi:hypothetical protein